MNNFELGVGLALGAGFIGLFIWMHFRIQKLESITLVEKEKIIDDKIVEKNHALTNDERDALLRSRLGN